MGALLNDIIRGIREVTLDQFPQPAFLVKKKPGTDDALSFVIGSKDVSLVKDGDVASLAELSLDNQRVAIFEPTRFAYTFYLDAGRPGNLTFKKSSNISATNVTEAVHTADYHKEILITVTSESGNEANTYTIQLFFRHPEELRTLSLNGLPYDEVPMYPNQNVALSSNIFVPPTFPDLERVRVTLQNPQEDFTFSVDNADQFTVVSDVGSRVYTLVRSQCPLLRAIEVNGNPIEGFFPEKDEYTIDIPVDLAEEIIVTTSPLIANDGRHVVNVRFDYTTTTHKVFLDVLLDSNVLNTYILNINYVPPTYSDFSAPAVQSSYKYEDYLDLIDLGRRMKSDTSQPFLFDFWPTLTQSDRPEELQNAILSNLSSEDPSVIFRKYFFSDLHYENIIRRYFDYYYPRRTAQFTLEEVFIDLPDNMRNHVILWSAFWAVEDRRTYELAAQSLVGGADNFDLQDNYSSLYSASSGPGTEVQVQIGSVFTLREDSGASSVSKKSGGPVAQVGADNILGDENSFWYRLQGFIRKRFEDTFRDYSLRSNEVIEGYDELSPLMEHNFMAFFDSYPFRVSPYSRGLFGGGRGVTDSSANYASGTSL